MRVVVQEWERVLVYRDGRFVEELGAGRHRRSRRRRRLVRVAVRPRLLVVPGQEVLTADGLAAEVSLTVTCRTADARLWHESVEDADAFAYAAVQVALREAVAVRTLEDLLAARATLADDVRERLGTGTEAVGVALERIWLRDVTWCPPSSATPPPRSRRPAPRAGGTRAGAVGGRGHPGAGQRRAAGGRAAGAAAAAHPPGRRGRRRDRRPHHRFRRPRRPRAGLSTTRQRMCADGAFRTSGCAVGAHPPGRADGVIRAQRDGGSRRRAAAGSPRFADERRPVPDPGPVDLASARGRTRAVRVSPHAESGLLAVSLWRDDRCVGSVHLTPEEAASLVGRLSDALAGRAGPPVPVPPAPDPVEDGLVHLERRLRVLEEGTSAPQT